MLGRQLVCRASTETRAHFARIGGGVTPMHLTH